ncbi:MAG: DegT/DnrJ/EryC1/StrS family aminotransferase [Desulfamplus sp.]|nr:DegT/DnrJ/EryC1/StrS family aminotransferase [Desulfamplus sp.]
MLPTLDYVAKKLLKQRGVPSNKVKSLVAMLMNNLFSFASVLTNYGFEQKDIYESAHDFEDAQIAATARSLFGSEVCIVTEDVEFDTIKEVSALTPAEALLWIRDNNCDRNSTKISFIDLATQQHTILPQIEKSISKIMRHGQYIMGPEVAELEEKLEVYVGAKHCITCASGTDALLMALMALDIAPDDEVITVPYTWISTAEVISLLRAKPVFVDILLDTFNMNPEKLESAINSRTRAIIPVGIYGQCADMTRINSIAEKYGIPVIEDAAQCFGSTHNGKKSCNLSVIGCTSFFPTKPLGCYGDGGAIFTNNDELADKMCQIRIHGQKVKHQHPIVGINGRLDTLQASILLEKFAIFPQECELRAKVAERYNLLLSAISDIQTPTISSGNSSVYAQYTILSSNRDRLSQSLSKYKIPSVAYYTVPLHLQGAFAYLGYKKGDFPIAEKISAQCLSLPMSPYLIEKEQQKIAKTIREKL